MSIGARQRPCGGGAGGSDWVELPLEPPLGTYDHLPPRAHERRRLEQRLRRLFGLWGYQEVITPSFELDEVVRLGGGTVSQRRLYRFVDREGQVLALRPDWTPAVARLVAGRLRDGPLPLRLFYVGNVFRYDRPRPDSPREFTQAGLELLGCPEALADAEVVALAVESCRQAGLPDVRVEIGHAGYVQALLARLPGGLQERARQSLMGRDVVAFRETVASAGVAADLARALDALPESRGDLQMLERAAQRCPVQEGRRALEALAGVVRHLVALGLEQAVAVDLGLVKDLDYYTGVVFEVYAPGAGHSLATGGRYDGLLARFGLPWPATGFAASIDRLVALGPREREADDGAPSVWVVTAGDAGRAWALAARLRESGVRVALDPLDRPLEQSLEAARRSQALWAVAPAGESLELVASLELRGSLPAETERDVQAWPRIPLARLRHQLCGPAEDSPLVDSSGASLTMPETAC